uniref:AN1-type domain-containing protein n=1 Tax=Dunaliella tertiolecta TaxID=3047 RepID=A0A6S8H1M8_DUNTE|mmetsp:Transcript_5126/g.13828  ORF Transcript_5126/g.13828 Transcript_5126/m.13828 type:complete len:210 (+) Transcript_5126:135-764(+)|eukprot:CAMPEP_0202353158 /NCGR_PEP_ID=MMETSP1126-20121109/9043_1 /ASSEMBLY_ACC=CAM_ASM_000457 /TAXON_ID=3047 /ORGANISM="Dunaliella tertiolecta, Strain CCMP1320" /LENGTH=209 /DNA_ID=CAMNT_0048945475 /DNA_START=84 /DNA_END=713 /DNA_ORIENTATION=-
MSQASQSENGQPSLCVAGCGFFSNIGTNGMCSKCHRDTQKAEQESAKAQQNLAQAAQLVRNAQQCTPAPPAPAPSSSPSSPAAQTVHEQQQQQHASTTAAAAAVAVEAAKPTTSSSAPEASSSAPAQPSASSSSATPPSKPPSTTRCLVCSKKVGLTGFNCKCNPDAVFCSAHRLAEAHDCTFDYKTSQRQLLAERNPVVQGAKVEKLG